MNYCIHTDKKIYSLDSSNACRSAFTALELTDNNLNLVKIDCSVKIDETVIATETSDLVPANYVLMDCVDGVCKQTQGYIIYNEKVYAFKGTQVGEAGTSYVSSADNGGQCAATDIGKLLSGKGGICIGNSLGVNFNTAGNYLILDGSSAVGAFSGNTDSVAIKRKAYYIIEDQFNSKGIKIKIF